ncbi:MAG: DUF4139 domain-containing protein [Proteobacteria bacterium]|nr:MAG: DUF4139 domain-containing protein [Pseudomonadota bacterium]
MTQQKVQLLLLMCLLVVGLTKLAAEENSVTVYSSTSGMQVQQNQYSNPAHLPGFAMVKESKTMDFKKGRFELHYDDVTAFIDPTSVSFSTPDNPGAAKLLDQNYRFDLLGTDSLLQRYLEQTITVTYQAGNDKKIITGRLLSTQGGLIIAQENGRLAALRSWQDIDFPQLPDGLLTKPTLVWLLDSNTGKSQTVAINYQTNGMTWWADYVAELDREEPCRLNLSAWVSLINQSGKSFNNYHLNLVAGDVNRSPQAKQQTMMRRESAFSSADSVQQESLFEYHKYRFPRRVDLPNNSSKQIRLINRTEDIQCEKKLLFDAFANQQFSYPRPITDANFNSQQQNPPIQAQLTFNNTQENQLGIPLPAGRIRVNQADTQGTLTFIGADRIDHTANKQTVSLTLGNSFDVNGRRQQSDFKRNKNTLVEQFNISLSNGKMNAETVTVIEHLYRWRQWHILDSSHDFTKTDANTITFQVTVPAEGELNIGYTVEYQWPEQLNRNN